MLNKIFIMGRFTKDPEIKATQSGKMIALFTIASERDFKNSSGEKETDFINCVAYGSTAEFIKSYFYKGSMAVVVGRLQIRNYTDKDGNKRTAAEIVTDSVYFADSKKDSKPVNVEYTDAEVPDGELPFD